MDADTLYSAWRGLKLFFRFGGHVSADAMHIHMGLIGFFVLFTLLRKTSRPVIHAWLVLLVCQIVNECIDIYFDLHKLGTVKEWSSVKDFVFTMFWPSIAAAFLLFRNNKAEIDTKQL